MAKIHDPNDKILIHNEKGGVFESTWGEYQNTLYDVEGVRVANDEMEPNKDFDIAYNDFDRRISMLSSNIRYGRDDLDDYTGDIKKLLSELRKYIKENPHNTRMKTLLSKLEKLQKSYKKGRYE